MVKLNICVRAVQAAADWLSSVLAIEMKQIGLCGDRKVCFSYADKLQLQSRKQPMFFSHFKIDHCGPANRVSSSSFVLSFSSVDVGHTTRA